MTARPSPKVFVAGALLAGAFVVLTGQTSRSTAPANHVAIAPTHGGVRTAPIHAISRAPRALSSEAVNAVVQQYCAGCHSQKPPIPPSTTPPPLPGNLSLVGFEMDSVTGSEARIESAEKSIKKLRANMMPPPGARRPAGDTLLSLVTSLEHVVDATYRVNPNPGSRPVQRINRAEYQRAIREILKLEVDPSRWLPADQMSANFDNIADVQTLSPTLLDSYLNAARDISRLALGDKDAKSTVATYTNSEFISQSQRDQIEGTPYGTRGGMVVTHDFPADGQYVFRINTAQGGTARLEEVDFSVDGKRVALVAFERGLQVRTDTLTIKAGQHKVSAAFVKLHEGPFEDLIRPHDFAQSANAGAGTSSLPHLSSLVITGPTNVTGVSDNPTRLKVFSCTPKSQSDERKCAQQIITRIGTEAYRRKLEARDVSALMAFYEDVAAEKGFEAGVGTALRAILASPHFVFRPERQVAAAKPNSNYRVADVDLASRLSFFIWNTPPDDELIELASKGKLRDTKVLERQAKRMLADPRAQSLGSRFAAQWLRIQDLDKIQPDVFWFPNWDRNLAYGMRRETEMLFNYLVKEDRGLFEFFNADYTFVNERLARHYGIPGVIGGEYRKVNYPDETRRGIFGHGSMLVQTSLGNRTSPVLRGKWVMEVLLGTPPPPPPVNVPDLEETGETNRDGKTLTTRERLELHRANVTCRSCHQYMDPIGLALDNFDVTGKWRYRENGMPLDTKGTLYDGTPIQNPSELAAALLKRPIPLARQFTENLMAYALGRRTEYYDQPTIREITRAAESQGHRMSSYILGVVRSAPFQMRRSDVVSTESAR